jgi:hypothetical protein
MLDFILLIIIAVGVWGIYWSIHKGFNQVIKGLESIDKRLANRENNR